MKCDICEVEINGRYFVNFFEDKFCESCSEYYKRCFCCGRLISNITDGGVVYNDSHYLCNICHKNVINTNESAIKHSKRVIKFMNSLGLWSKHDFKIKISNNKELKNLTGHIYTTIHYTNDEITAMEFEIKILPLEKHFFCGVLAHELFHMFIKLNHIQLEQSIEEGFAELCNYLYLKKSKSFFYSKYKKRYINSILNRIANNQDKIYGDGFRYIYNLYKNIGMRKLKKKILTI